MSKKITVGEFQRDYCQKLSFNKFILSYENQETFNNDFQMLRMTFDEIAFMSIPNTITFKCGRDCLSFCAVRYITIKEKSILGLVFIIYYGCDDENVHSYTVIAQ